jgi:DNA polymerase-3 subunit gamma/tau
MAYVALYRKYRSQSFGELMGQEAVTTTLQNAIRSKRVAQAFLFYGARGCGKTSTARLLARALNCEAHDGPNPEPCGVCRLCVSIRDGHCMDVVEMDAASETGIDDVREKIIENVQYAPGEARYKVYIIDEVHDLSVKAFDALLKTLEEPPAHVFFILATTEFHKVPITIRSRCQQFQFKRGTLNDLAASVQKVVTAENYTAEPEAVQAIARAAEGSWRDALSLLEQVLAYSDNHVTAATVQRALGTVGQETLARVTEILARGCWDETLTIAGELIDSGKDARQLLTALQGHLRDLMLISAGAKQAAAQELGPERLALLSPQAALFDPPTLLAMMSVLAGAEREIRFTNQHRWLLESTLLRLLTANQGVALPAAQAEAVVARPVVRPTTQRPSEAPLAATPALVPKPPPPGTTHLYIDRAVVEPEAADEPPAMRPEAALPVASPPVPVFATSPPVAASAPETETPSGARFAEDMTLEVLQRAWPRLLKALERSIPAGHSFLKDAEVVNLEGRFIVLAFQSSFARDRIQNNEKGRVRVEQIINATLQTEGYRVRCILTDGGGGQGAGASGAGASGAAKPPPTGAPTNAVLLDTPVNTPSAPTRIADFQMPGSVPLPPEPTPARPNAANGTAVAPSVPPVKTASPPPAAVETGLLEDALAVFQGEIVSAEPL